MVKIIFELSEEFIIKSTEDDYVKSRLKEAEGKDCLRVLIDAIAFKSLAAEIEKGKTEFVVTPDKLSEDSLTMYNKEIAEICLLATASEKDNASKEAES